LEVDFTLRDRPGGVGEEDEFEVPLLGEEGGGEEEEGDKLRKEKG
jgi:hypothetical protein